MGHLQGRKTGVARLSIISNTILMILKLITGIAIGSVSIISEAMHSGMDLLAAFIAYAAVKTSGKPADGDHPFGHGKIENISGVIEALLIFIAACWIIYEALKKFLHPEPIISLSWGVTVMIFSMAVNWVVSNKLFAVAKDTDSIALEADAWHLRTDVYTSAGVMFGLFCIWTGEYFFPGIDLQWIDPVAAIAVALLIGRTAYTLTVQSAQDLMDTTLPEDEETFIMNLVMEKYPKAHGFHKLRTRKAGRNRFIEFHLKVDPKMTVEDSHDITEEINNGIVKRFPHSTVNIHVEPCDGRCDSDCEENCLLTEKERERVKQR